MLRSNEQLPKSAPGHSGKARLLFKGRCVLGPDLRLAVAAAFAILIPSIIYTSFCLPWLTRRWTTMWTLVAVVVPLQITMIALFLRTAISDPGIVPRQADCLLPQDIDWYNQITPIAPPKHQDVTIHGHLFKMKYCSTCNFYRPPRCVHCSICDNCVDKFDHHCPWVGNCVGRRNYRSFIVFVLSTSLYVIIVTITAPLKFLVVLKDLAEANNSYRRAFKDIWGEAWDAIVLTVLALAFLWFLLGLSGYHTYLITSNQTTYEQIKGFFDEKQNPWDRGIMRNISELLLQRRRPKIKDKDSRDKVIVYSCLALNCVSESGRVESGGVLKTRVSSNIRHSSRSMKPPNTGATTYAPTSAPFPRNTPPSSNESALMSGDVELNVYPSISPVIRIEVNHQACPKDHQYDQNQDQGDDEDILRGGAQVTTDSRFCCAACLNDLTNCRCTTFPTRTPTTESRVPPNSPFHQAGWVAGFLTPFGTWAKSFARSGWLCVVPPE